MEVQITQDLRKYKPKEIGGFSAKDAGIIAIGVAGAVIVYAATKNIDLCLIPLGIMGVIGFFKPFGMTFIQFVRTVLVEKITPQLYINETDFVYDPAAFEELYGEEIYVPEIWNDVDLPNQSMIVKEDLPYIIK